VVAVDNFVLKLLISISHAVEMRPAVWRMQLPWIPSRLYSYRNGARHCWVL